MKRLPMEMNIAKNSTVGKFEPPTPGGCCRRAVCPNWAHCRPSGHAEPPDGGFFGERCGHLRQGLAQGGGVDTGACDGLPCDFVLSGGDGLCVPHGGLERVFQGLGLLLGFLDQGLELAQLPGLTLHFLATHTFSSLSYFGELGGVWNVLHPLFQGISPVGLPSNRGLFKAAPRFHGLSIALFSGAVYWHNTLNIGAVFVQNTT